MVISLPHPEWEGIAYLLSVRQELEISIMTDKNCSHIFHAHCYSANCNNSIRHVQSAEDKEVNRSDSHGQEQRQRSEHDLRSESVPK